MSWKDFLRSASFRGVSFFVDTSQSTIGRKIALHEYPGKDQNLIEDLGKITPVYDLTAFVVGDLYKFQKNALEKALNKSGPGKLIHPYYGSIDVVVIGGITVDESTRDGGMASFSITFVKYKEPELQKGLISSVANLTESSLVAFNSAKDIFNDTFSLIRQPAAIVNATIGIINDSISAIESAFITIKNVAGFKDSLDGIKSLIVRGSFLADELSLYFIDLFSLDIPGTPLEAEKSIAEKLELDSFGSETVDITENVKATKSLISICSLAGSAKSLASITFDSKQSANDIKNIFVSSFDVAMDVANDVDYEILETLRGAVLNDIEARSINLPTIQNVKLNIALSSSQVAYDLYEDASRGDDIAKRNTVLHPGIVQRNVELEVLSR